MKKYILPIVLILFGAIALIPLFSGVYSDSMELNIGFGLAMLTVGFIIIGLIRNSEKVEESKQEAYYPIKFNRYHKCMYIKGMNETMIRDLITSHEELENGFHREQDFEIKAFKGSNLLQVECPSSIDFYEFHNLVGWMFGTGEHSCSEIYGVAKSSSDKEQSYYVTMDEEVSCGDTLVGVMNSGMYFRVYLPEAYVDGGNIIPMDTGNLSVGVEGFIELLKG